MHAMPSSDARILIDHVVIGMLVLQTHVTLILDVSIRPSCATITTSVRKIGVMQQPDVYMGRDHVMIPMLALSMHAIQQQVVPTSPSHVMIPMHAHWIGVML